MRIANLPINPTAPTFTLYKVARGTGVKVPLASFIPPTVVINIGGCLLLTWKL